MPYGWSDLALGCGGLCSMSDTMESFKEAGGSPILQPSVRIKHLTRNSDGSSRFPKLDECAHFHYDNVELGPIEVLLTEADDRADEKHPNAGEYCVQVTSNGKSWQIRRSLDNFQMLDRQLHRCVYDRKFSALKEIAVQPQMPEDALHTMLTQYLERFSQLAGSLINCGPVLNWLELDNRGNRLIVTDEAAINTPAVAAAYVIKRYASQANDEISLEVGDIISVIDMPPPAESSWWRGKKGFQVGFFPCECVEIIGDKVPQSFKIPKSSAKPVLRKHGKLIAFFRSFLLSRPSRRKLKQSGILKERVFGCDLGEHLMNTSRDIPLVLKCCTEFIEQYGIVDGIYRLSGVTSNIQKLRLAFDEDRVPNLTDEAILQDIHCVASLLKMYFRELPNPLLTFHLYDKFVNAVQADEDLRLLKLRDVVQQLPPPHYRSLEYLMRHLSKVAAFGFQTGMTPKNVAIVWAPNLLRSRDLENGAVGALHVVGVQAVLTEYLIRYTDIIFSEKMPVFPSPKINEETPKKTRPKSLAISTPTKLLSLEEARSRALTSNLPGEQQKFIDVGGGEENLPIKYHTVIELPTRRRSVGKSKKSPSGWKSFFSRGWHTTSGRRKNRRDPERLKIGSPIFADNSPLLTQDKAVTESDVSHTNSKKLRTVKSAENLFPMNSDLSQQLVAYAFSPLEEIVTSPLDDDSKDFKDSNSPNASPSKYSLYQKHIRSISHDSYFERNIDFTVDGESEHEEKANEGSVTTSTKNTVDFEKEQVHLNLASKDDYGSDSASDSPARRFKSAQKQKRLSLDTEASSPKLQKLSLKRLYNTLSSPPMEKRKEMREKGIGMTSNKSSLVQKEVVLQNRAQEQSVPVSGPMLQDSSHPVPLTSNFTKLPETANPQIHDTDTVTAEIHTFLPDSKFSESLIDQDDSCEMLVSNTIDDLDNLIDFSMEATLSESVNLSQLCSFDSPENGAEQQLSLGFVATDNSLATPDSPTGDNISDIPSSGDSEISEGNNFKSANISDNIEHTLEYQHVSSSTAKVKENAHSKNNHSSNSALQQSPLHDNIVNDIILSPPESFHDAGKTDSKSTLDELGKAIASDIRSSAKSPGARTMERSKTEVHEICPKLVSGIAVSGSFGQELFRANCEFVDSKIFNKKRSCSDKLSPISPIEDSKRKFESEIGRLIMRDRQMKMEMEKMKAERLKYKGLELPPVSEIEKNRTKPEKKFADALDFRKSPVKSFEEKKKVDHDDFFKSQKENIEGKKLTDTISSQNLFRFLSMENKPSVKELLSKFESRKQFGDNAQKYSTDTIFNSPSKHSSNIFSNVQVINRNFPLTPSKSMSSAAESLKQSSQDNHNSLSKDHIFQTECVIRFPPPKSSILTQIQNDCPRNVSGNLDLKCDRGESNSWSSGQYGHHTKGNQTRTSFLSSDNLSNSPSRCRNDLSVTQGQELFSNEQPRLSRSAECKRTTVSADTGRTTVGNDNSSKLDQESNSFSSFKDTFNRANRLTAQMRNEFLMRGVPQDNGNFMCGQSEFSVNNGVYLSGSPPVSRRRQPPIRQRPKSVPPPLSRLSLANTNQSPTAYQGSHTQLSKNVPNAESVNRTNGKEPIDSSQNYGPPKCVRDRAAIFERSLSFSGQTEPKTLPFSDSQKAQEDSTAR
ncbi:hypothetical protein JTE90_023610 [Oedothorax gibbosus]|uniref:GTPase-activating protein CdGAPr n=1 Tax=Oedothorax gibbosus TaxID=931172 RepID=A0AAV6TZM1_9ARAC|nr:hypothetical protein JTE90_023610 [Oedothorax gibbosus]